MAARDPHDKFEGMGIGTRAIHAGILHDEFGSAAPAIYQTSTFVFDNAAQGTARFAGKEKGFIYTRLGNPTTAMLERAVADLEHGYGGMACASGMGASNTVMLAYMEAGAHVVCSEAVYGPVRVLLENFWSKYGVQSTFVDSGDMEAIKKAVRPNTRMIYVETPCNPTLSICDMKATAELAHSQANCVFVVDNTFMSPILQRPIDHGADVVIHSVTKFLNGHSDVVGGVIVTKNEAIHKKLLPMWKNLGATMDPHQAWCVLRGIKTLKMRVLCAQENAKKVAELLTTFPQIKSVSYPGLKSFSGAVQHAKQADGPGSLISFDMKGGIPAAQHVLNRVKVVSLAVSLGGVESLIQHPAGMTHCGMKPEDRLKAGITDGMIRLSIGCEDVEDLLKDFKQAMEGCPM